MKADQTKQMKADMEKLMESRLEAEQQASTTAIKMDVLVNYFKEKETELNRLETIKWRGFSLYGLALRWLNRIWLVLYVALARWDPRSD